MSRRLTLLVVAAAIGALMMVAVAQTGLAASARPTVVSAFPYPYGPNPVLVQEPWESHIHMPDAQIWVDFSEPMRKASINDRTFRLYKGHFSYEELNGGDGGPSRPPVRRCVGYLRDTRSAISDPYPYGGSCLGETLIERRSTAYTAVVEGAKDGDGQAVKDRDGNRLARDFILQFTTCGSYDFTDGKSCLTGARRMAR